ncbi:hypothetical protein BV898_01067 [Hypsibius exemplaris]|uniref:Uncharacterized protein n=1 Tax=Hypsibius exemplaris TaxID=2072580 RepID=A0A1W0XDA9_HYPEX|nr:hypothetical protein BV898_01067 [Hypsibius exemplaris]
MASTCNNDSTTPDTSTFVMPQLSASAIPPEVLALFILNFLAIFCLILRLSKAERLIADLVNHRVLDGHGMESVQKELEALRRHKQRITIQENVYQKVLVQVETKTKELTTILEAKEKLLERATEKVTKLAASYQSSLPEFTRAVSSLRHEVSELHVKLESEVSSLHYRLSSFSSPASSLNCLATSENGGNAKPETLYVHRTILPEKNVNDEFVHVPGIGLISTEELDQMDCSYTPFDASVKTLKKKRANRFGNPLRWIRRKTANKGDLRMAAELVEEDRASFGFRSRL